MRAEARNKHLASAWRARGSALLVAALSVAGLSAVASPPAAAVIGGTTVTLTASSPLRAIVVVVGLRPPTSDRCSGTLIGTQWVLTAVHCTNANEDPKAPFSPSSMEILIPSGTADPVSIAYVSEIYRHPGYSSASGYDDVALLKLAAPVTGIAPVPLLSGPDFGSVNEVAAYGYGITRVGGTTGTTTPKKAREQRVDPTTLSFPDCPGGGSFDLAGALFTTPIDGGTSHGDSGGPATVDRGGGAPAVAGVTMGAVDTQACVSSVQPDPVNRSATWVGIYNRVDTWSPAGQWVQSVAGAGLPAPAVLPSPTVPTPRPQTKPPAAPTLSAQRPGTTTVPLAWTVPSGAPVGYRVYEGSTLKASVNAPTTTATIGGLASNSTHTFQVTAYNAGGESPRSNAVTVTTLATWTTAFISQSATDASSGASADLAHARPGQRFNVTMTVRNTGTATWTPSGSPPVLLGTTAPTDHTGVFATNGWVSPNRPARLRETAVPPGATGTFVFPVVAPEATGTVSERYRLVAEGLTWMNDIGLTVTVTTVPVVGMAIAPGTAVGQWVVASDGGVFAFAGAPFYGSMGGKPLNAPVVGIAGRAQGTGYWLVGADGGVFAFGTAPFAGSMAGQPLNRPVVGITGTPSGNGYWLVAADGGVFAYGDAPFLGSMAGKPLSAPVVGIAATPTGRGYWLTAGDGGVFAYGDAVFAGSMVGKPLNGPIVGIVGTGDGRGYWLAGRDGGVYAFGAAPFGGSLGANGSGHPVVGLGRTAAGYALVDTAGLVSAFTTPGSPAPRTTLYPGEMLFPGEQLTSGNGRYVLVMQGDGNLVEYDAGRPVWASNTSAAGSTFEAQRDGNFVVYAPGHVARWATNTFRAGSIIRVQDDRNVVIVAPDGAPVWATGTNI